MSNFGIGLGAFMTGAKDGYGLVSDVKNRNAQLDRQKSDQAYQDYQRDRQKTLDARADDTYRQTEKQRQEIEAIGLDARRQFDAKVRSGEAKSRDFNAFWTKNVAPRLQQTYLSSGDTAKAAEVAKWSDTEAARQGGKLALNAMTLAQQGDYSGALKAAQQAATVKGYIDHPYTINRQEEIVDKDGKHLGYRLFMTGKDGTEFAQDLPDDKIAGMISAYLNPQAAFESQATAAADARELSKYKRRKQIDAEFSDGKARQQAIKNLRDTWNGELNMDGETIPRFDDMSNDEQERLIADEIALQRGVKTAGSTGTSGAATDVGQQPGPKKQVLVDTVSGKPVTIGIGR